MIYGPKEMFRFTAKVATLLEKQDDIFDTLELHVYGGACLAISQYVQRRHGIPAVLVGLRKSDGTLTPHFINQTVDGNLVDLKNRVAVHGNHIVWRMKTQVFGDHLLPTGRTPQDYVFGCTKGDFPARYRDAFQVFRNFLKTGRGAGTWTPVIRRLMRL